MSDVPDLTLQERAVLALWLLIQAPLSTREIAERCGMAGAYLIAEGTAQLRSKDLPGPALSPFARCTNAGHTNHSTRAE